MKDCPISEPKKYRPKILFFAHAVTLAHFARPFKWAESLSSDEFDIYFASHPKYRDMVERLGATFIDLDCIDAEQFANAVGQATKIYDLKTFEDHIAEDLTIIEKIKPDLVIGDYRLSLSVSCRRLGVKYISLADAYWSPESLYSFPLPEAPLVRLLGEKIASIVLKLFLPSILKFNFYKLAAELRKPLRSVSLYFRDFRELLTDGDITLYVETADFVPLKKKKLTEMFIGPQVWSMPVNLPGWWNELNPNKKWVLLSLGSSGQADCLPLVCNALSMINVEVIVALAGKKIELPKSANIHVTDFLPLNEVCKKVDLVICNGGSPVSHAALSNGVPVIGIVSNNDQLLNMNHIEKHNAGMTLRYWKLSLRKVIKSVTTILNSCEYYESAKKLQADFTSHTFDLQKLLKFLLGKNLDPSAEAKVAQKEGQTLSSLENS